MRITEPNYYRYYKRLGLFTKLATSYIAVARHKLKKLYPVIEHSKRPT
jgi:hypothetical protein